MMDLVGRIIRVYFLNGLQTEGTVQSWSEKEAVLVQHLDNRKEFTIISNTNRDVQMVIILAEKNNSQVVSSEEPKVDLRVQKLADLHKLKMVAEKEEIARKFKTHYIDSSKVKLALGENVPDFSGPKPFDLLRGVKFSRRQ